MKTLSQLKKEFIKLSKGTNHVMKFTDFKIKYRLYWWTELECSVDSFEIIGSNKFIDTILDLSNVDFNYLDATKNTLDNIHGYRDYENKILDFNKEAEAYGLKHHNNTHWFYTNSTKILNGQIKK